MEHVIGSAAKLIHLE